MWNKKICTPVEEAGDLENGCKAFFMYLFSMKSTWFQTWIIHINFWNIMNISNLIKVLYNLHIVGLHWNFTSQKKKKKKRIFWLSGFHTLTTSSSCEEWKHWKDGFLNLKFTYEFSICWVVWVLKGVLTLTLTQ